MNSQTAQDATEHLTLVLAGPMMAFGDAKVDSRGVITLFPTTSMLTGLLANAMGWERTQPAPHQTLHSRLAYAARIDREPRRDPVMSDYQTAAIRNTDRFWTTRGRPEGRSGGTYTTQILNKEYQADTLITVALRLEPGSPDLNLDIIETALRRPARPLYLGRKSCLPSRPILAGRARGRTALEALLSIPLEHTPSHQDAIPTLWQAQEDLPGIPHTQERLAHDHFDWNTRLHGLGRTVYEARLDRDRFPQPPEEQPESKEHQQQEAAP